MRDNWCVGYSRRYTVGVWVGNFSGAPMHDVSGVTGAAPLWQEIMNFLHDADPGPVAEPPAGLIRSLLRAEGLPAKEWFIRGTEPAPDQPSDEPAVVRITYPPAGAVFALDPDIPSGRQRIVFAIQGRTEKLHWVLNGRTLGSAEAPVSWAPAAGRHLLALKDGHGTTLDSVRFQVRGRPDAED
jgi:penicillin-binding protein 1C